MTQPPNILLINCDDLGWGDLGCYGHPQHQTLHVDQLAAEGMQFTDFYMASPVCSPSRAAMLTGCYPRRVGFGTFTEGRGVLFPGDPLGLHPNEITLAQMLKDKGYRTRLIGKWHCGDQPEFLPTQFGFDGYYGLPYSNDMGRQRWANEGEQPQWMADAPPLPLLLDDDVIEQQPDLTSLTARYVDDALRFMREDDEADDAPFFLYFAHAHVHLPHYVSDRFLKESSNGRYGAAVAEIDWALGMLMTELKRLGLDDNTLVLFTSDNGSRADYGPSNGYLRGRKVQTWEGGQRVPLIARWPGHIPAASVQRGLASAIDFLPTLATLTDADIPTDRQLDGVDISTLLMNTDTKSPREVFAYYSQDTLEAVRVGQWKLHVRKAGEGILELYDLQHDPSESQNCANDHPDVVQTLQRHIAQLRTDLGDAATGDAGNCRPVGRVSTGQPLTQFDPNHPYYMAEYDLSERG